MRKPTVLASFLLTLSGASTRHGIDGPAVLLRHGIDVNKPVSLSDRIPTAAADKLFAEMSHLAGGPEFALAAGQCWHPHHLGPIGCAWLSSASLADGLRLLERYSSILGERAWLICRYEEDGLRIIVDPRHDRNSDSSIAIAAFVLSITAALCQQNFPSHLEFVEVTFQHPEPENLVPYIKAFGATLHFDHPYNSILLHHDDANLELPTVDAEVVAIMDKRLRAEMDKLHGPSFSDRAGRVIIKTLPHGNISEERVAKALGVTRRTLHRRLSDEGRTYTTLLDGVRRNIAETYINDPERPVVEIAFLLGFSCSSTLIRAFRRWFGTTPTAYRKMKNDQAQ